MKINWQIKKKRAQVFLFEYHKNLGTYLRRGRRSLSPSFDSECVFDLSTLWFMWTKVLVVVVSRGEKQHQQREKRFQCISSKMFYLPATTFKIEESSPRPWPWAVSGSFSRLGLIDFFVDSKAMSTAARHSQTQTQIHRHRYTDADTQISKFQVAANWKGS